MSELIARDLRYVWHPCSQMKDYIDFPAIIIKSAKGSYFELDDGRKVVDAISSWWCKSLGHAHPRLKRALTRQLERFEHVILANTTNELIVKLSEKLAGLTNSLAKVFYASDGSSAIEIAIKMSLHANQIMGNYNRKQFIALKNSYHGETGLALSISDLGIYKDPYKSILMATHFIQTVPYVSNKEDPLWYDCSNIWSDVEKQLNKYSETAAAIIVEPIVQGTGNMKIYSKNFLQRLSTWTKKRGIHLIADEIMTGLGRTGSPLACQHAGIEPDFLCLGKSLTAGFLPMSVTLTSNKIYDLFYDDYKNNKSFLHSHTYSGNALAASVALEHFNILTNENIYQQVRQREPLLKKLFTEIAEYTGMLINIRNIGAIVAADLITNDPQQRLGFKVFQQAINFGAYLRPLGNTIYWLPPLNITEEDLYRLKDITQKSILAVCN